MTIAGASFGPITQVRFGDVSAPWFAVDSTSRLRAAVPAHAAGAVHVTVVGLGGGVSEPTAGSIVTYAAPVAPVARAGRQRPAGTRFAVRVKRGHHRRHHRR